MTSDLVGSLKKAVASLSASDKWLLGFSVFLLLSPKFAFVAAFGVLGFYGYKLVKTL